MKTPKWAKNFVQDALVFLEEQGYKVTVPTIKWRYHAGHNSSGRASGWALGEQSIITSAGKSRLDTKLVILHELAHTVTEPRPVYRNIERAKKNCEPDQSIVIKTICHTPEFWDTAWKLYRWAKLPIRYCQQRECSYRAGAQIAYKQSRRASKHS